MNSFRKNRTTFRIFILLLYLKSFILSTESHTEEGTYFVQKNTPWLEKYLSHSHTRMKPAPLHIIVNRNYTEKVAMRKFEGNNDNKSKINPETIIKVSVKAISSDTVKRNEYTPNDTTQKGANGKLEYATISKWKDVYFTTLDGINPRYAYTNNSPNFTVLSKDIRQEPTRTDPSYSSKRAPVIITRTYPKYSRQNSNPPNIEYVRIRSDGSLQRGKPPRFPIENVRKRFSQKESSLLSWSGFGLQDLNKKMQIRRGPSIRRLVPRSPLLKSIKQLYKIQ